MKYDLNNGDKKSTRHYLINVLINQYLQQQQSQSGSGFIQYVFLPLDPDELLDQLKMLYSDKVGGNGNTQLNKQIIAIVYNLLEYECITTNQHPNLMSTFTEVTEGAVRVLRDSKEDQFVD